MPRSLTAVGRKDKDPLTVVRHYEEPTSVVIDLKAPGDDTP